MMIGQKLARGYKSIKIIIHTNFYLSAGEIQGAYQIKVTTSALALLLSTRHVELAKINVQHHLIKVCI